MTIYECDFCGNKQSKELTLLRSDFTTMGHKEVCKSCLTLLEKTMCKADEQFHRAKYDAFKQWMKETSEHMKSKN